MTSGSGAVRIACPNLADFVVGISYGLLDLERIRGWIARLTMTDDEFDDALNALSKSDYLQKVAARSGFAPDSKDAVQDVLLTLSCLKPHQYRGIRDLQAYAEKAVRRRAIRLALARRDKTRPHVNIDANESQSLEQTSFEDPFESYELEEKRQLVRTAIELLDPLERAIARATHFEGESGPAIASRTGMTLDVIRGARDRALEKLKKFVLGLVGNEGRRDRDEP
jgi:RNA polymerase sigma factor (sigma-70 family)